MNTLILKLTMILFVLGFQKLLWRTRGKSVYIYVIKYLTIDKLVHSHFCQTDISIRKPIYVSNV